MKQRVVTALLITPFAVALILLSPSVLFAAIIATLCLIALWEWTRLSGMRSRPQRAVLVSVLAVAMYVLRDQADTPLGWTAVAAGCIFWFGAIAWLRHFSFAAATSLRNTSIKLAAGVLAVLPAWTALMQVYRMQDSPHTWALYSLVLVWAADTFAYLAGSRWGKKKLAPKISPGKTMAGVYGALVGSAVVATIGGQLLGVHAPVLIGLVVVALISVLFSIVGDLFESLIKRHANVKDSGALFPGHGGVFDRLDGVFAALPIFMLGKFLLGL